MTTVPTTSFHNHRCLNAVPTLLFHKLALCKTAAQHSGSPIWSSGIIAHPNLTNYLRAILCFLLLSQPVTAYHMLADCIHPEIPPYNCQKYLTWHFFTLVSLAENSEELEIFIDFDRWDCRRIESSREYFTEPEVLTRTLLALWTLFTPIILKVH